jgi:LytS/YehU family sensor histidine kinase
VGAATDAQDVQPPGSGLGLKIIAERLRTLYQGRASLNFQAAESLGSRVTILIPRNEAAM